MTNPIATGTFDVELTPLPADEEQGRLRIEKRYRGDLEGSARGEMLTWRAEEGLPAAYVAIERVEGTLASRRGSFVLTHVGTMTGEDQRLRVRVVPGSGTDGLAGLSGTMTITIEGREHRYALEYELPDPPP